MRWGLREGAGSLSVDSFGACRPDLAVKKGCCAGDEPEHQLENVDCGCLESPSGAFSTRARRLLSRGAAGGIKL